MNTAFNMGILMQRESGGQNGLVDVKKYVKVVNLDITSITTINASLYQPIAKPQILMEIVHNVILVTN